jgi:glycosyltransferase involved in cell wall biosynthesis
MKKPAIAILHYTAPPVIGGVEAVIAAHARTMCRDEYPVTIVAGRGAPDALEPGVTFVRVPEVDSLDAAHPETAEIHAKLLAGQLPDDFDDLVDRTREALEPHLVRSDVLIVHNIFFKHFNLPLTAALWKMLDDGVLPTCISWGHDFSWTSPSSRKAVHEGYPWDLLRRRRSDVVYVTVSVQRQGELAQLLGCPPEEISVVYCGVDPKEQLGLSRQGAELAEHLDLFGHDPVLLMPVRVTGAKNIELALKVVAELKRLDCRPKLVLTGPPDPHDAASMAYFDELRAQRRHLGVEAEMAFVYERSLDGGEPLVLDARTVGELYRLADMLFMPSHREGFGMPVLEAGLAGLPVACTEIPSAMELAADDVLFFKPDDNPAEIADRILARLVNDPTYRLRRRVRARYTWDAILKQDIAPLLARASASTS